MNPIEYKSEDGSVMDVDTEKKTVKCVWSRMGNVDLDNDVIAPDAFTKTISERGPQGKNMIWSLTDHMASLKYAIGKPKELFVQGDMLVAVTTIADTEWGEDVLKMYRDGLINQHSIGFSTVKAERVDGMPRMIKEVMLYEGSAVLWGANPETPTLEVTKGVTQQKKLSDRLERLQYAWKSGRYTDETFSLIEIEIKSIQNELLKIESTQAAEKSAPVPDYSDILSAINNFNNKFKK